MFRCYVHVGRDDEKDFISYELRDVVTGENIAPDVIEKEGLWKQNKLVDHAFVMEQLRKIVGKTLTIIDASVVDKRQNKAMKDLVRNVVSDEMEHLAEMLVDQREMQEMIDEIPEEELEKAEGMTVDVLEALGVDESKR